MEKDDEYGLTKPEHSQAYVESQHRNGVALREELRRRVSDGIFVSPAQKYDETTAVNFMIDVITWFEDHPTEISTVKYYLDPKTNKAVSPAKSTWHYLRKRFATFNQLNELLQQLCADRIMKKSLTGEWKENMGKFLLVNNYGMKDRTETDVNLTTKLVKFNFGNEELKEKENEDEFDELDDDQV